MEWVETTGKSVEEATNMALDRLGVLDTEAEVEIVEEPSQGMFGRIRGQARVRARVRPSTPPPKTDRQRKGRRSSEKDTGRSQNQSEKEPVGTTAPSSSSKKAKEAPSQPKHSAQSDREPMPEDEQRSAGEDFLRGLIEAFGLEASISSSLDADGILAFEVEGERLGLLMGPGLNTLDAVQEVCRNAIQRRAEGREYGKVHLDVSGVRAARTAALEDFVREQAQVVAGSGEDVIFEVMSRTDRKTVHDVISGVDGVETESVGEDPRRRVVLRPA